MNGTEFFEKYCRVIPRMVQHLKILFINPQHPYIAEDSLNILNSIRKESPKVISSFTVLS